jgi:hypothetical protein
MRVIVWFVMSVYLVGCAGEPTTTEVIYVAPPPTATALLPPKPSQPASEQAPGDWAAVVCGARHDLSFFERGLKEDLDDAIAAGDYTEAALIVQEINRAAARVQASLRSVPAWNVDGETFVTVLRAEADALRAWAVAARAVFLTYGSSSDEQVDAAQAATRHWVKQGNARIDFEIVLLKRYGFTCL